MRQHPPVLIRGRILTMHRERPEARALLLADGRVAALDAEALAARASAVKEIETGRGVAVPGFVDAHMHVLAAAARKLAVDCSPAAVGSIEAIVEAIRRRARDTAPGEWVRAAGYDEVALAERRHPTRHDLDAAAPNHPVRLFHRTGHASVLNSLALRLAGIGSETPEPPGGYMERDLDSGEPTGLLIEMEDMLEGIAAPLPEERLAAAVSALDGDLLAAGITWLEDATATNTLDDWALMERLLVAGRLSTGVSMMESYGALGAFPESGAGGRLRRAGVKVMPRDLEHEVHPPPHQLAVMLARIDAAGRQAAVHAVSRRAVQSALEAYRLARPRAGVVHRIEHAGVCGVDASEEAAALGLAVVTQPGFLYWHGDSFLRRADAADLSDFYPLRRLLDAGIALAASSDAPVAPVDVLAGLRAAVTRRTMSGATIAPSESIRPAEALALYTLGAARVLGLEGERGRLLPRHAADVVLLSEDPRVVANLDDLRVEATFVGGERVYQRRETSAGPG